MHAVALKHPLLIGHELNAGEIWSNEVGANADVVLSHDVEKIDVGVPAALSTRSAIGRWRTITELCIAATDCCLMQPSADTAMLFSVGQLPVSASVGCLLSH